LELKRNTWRNRVAKSKCVLRPGGIVLQDLRLPPPPGRVAARREVMVAVEYLEHVCHAPNPMVEL
jgi:hypothetical protein